MAMPAQPHTPPAPPSPTIACPHCGGQCSASARFCGHCRQAIQQQAAAPVATGGAAAPAQQPQGAPFSPWVPQPPPAAPQPQGQQGGGPPPQQPFGPTPPAALHVHTPPAAGRSTWPLALGVGVAGAAIALALLFGGRGNLPKPDADPPGRENPRPDPPNPPRVDTPPPVPPMITQNIGNGCCTNGIPTGAQGTVMRDVHVPVELQIPNEMLRTGGAIHQRLPSGRWVTVRSAPPQAEPPPAPAPANPPPAAGGAQGTPNPSAQPRQ